MVVGNKQRKAAVNLILFSVLVLGLWVEDAVGQLPEGWKAGGGPPDHYEVGGDPEALHGSESSGYIKSKMPQTQGRRVDKIGY